MSEPLPKTEVIFADDSRESAVYRVIPLNHIVASHEPTGSDFRADRRYPSRVQHRQYAGLRGQSARLRVEQAAQHLDPDQLLDPTRTAAVGPPLVAQVPDEWVAYVPDAAERYLCVAGNQRTLLLMLAWERWANTGARAYLDALVRRVSAFGFSDAQCAAVAELANAGHRPVLVRLLAQRDGRPRVATLDTLAAINRKSDAAFTKARDLHTLALTIAAATDVAYATGRANATPSIRDDGEPTPGTPERRNEGQGATREGERHPPSDGLTYLARTIGQRTPVGYARSSFAVEFLDRLVRTDVLPATEQASFVNPYTQRLNAAGQYLIELIIAALAFTDPGIFDAVSPDAMRRARGALQTLVALRGRYAELGGDPVRREQHLKACGRTGKFARLSTPKLARSP